MNTLERSPAEPHYAPPPLEVPNFNYTRQSDPVGEANRAFMDYLNHQ